jgi:hypothetical protein
MATDVKYNSVARNGLNITVKIISEIKLNSILCPSMAVRTVL